MTSPPVPPQAITAEGRATAIVAIAKALVEVADDFGSGNHIGGDALKLAEAALEAAAPHLAADLAVQLEHAKAALAADNEGVRLWMLDCGALVEQHRKRADEATAAERERCARLAESYLCPCGDGDCGSTDTALRIAALLREAQLCLGGCGCRLGTYDADRFECGCDAGCCEAQP